MVEVVVEITDGIVKRVESNDCEARIHITYVSEQRKVEKVEIFEWPRTQISVYETTLAGDEDA